VIDASREAGPRSTPIAYAIFAQGRLSAPLKSASLRMTLRGRVQTAKGTSRSFGSAEKRFAQDDTARSGGLRASGGECGFRVLSEIIGQALAEIRADGGAGG
jgi:hypothetical protein